MIPAALAGFLNRGLEIIIQIHQVFRDTVQFLPDGWMLDYDGILFEF
jgi:hypothetical protein